MAQVNHILANERDMKSTYGVIKERVAEQTLGKEIRRKGDCQKNWKKKL